MFKQKKKRKTKTNIVFDDTARMEYLTGFQKRKNERRKKAMEEKVEKQKEERRDLRKQKRELLQSRMRKGLSSEPEVEQLVEPEIFNLPDHTVTVTDVSAIDMAGHDGLRLGQNTFIGEDTAADGTVQNLPDIRNKVKKINSQSKLLSLQKQKNYKKSKKKLGSKQKTKKKSTNSFKTNNKKKKKKH